MTDNPDNRRSRSLRTLLWVAVLALLWACTSTTEPESTPAVTPADPNAGVLTTARGKERRIRPEDLDHTGRATYRWPSGRVYSGQLKDGKPDGKGRDERPDGTVYDGEWRSGLPNGFGVLVDLAGNRYNGSFKDGLRNGKGEISGPGGHYTGDWLGDVPHGVGAYSYPDGSRFEGQFARGARHGEGEFTSASNGTYMGSWAADAPDGFGTLEENGSRYEGQWQGGKRSGYGALTTVAGLRYEGTWLDGKRHGFGREVRFDGSSYKGEWALGARSGQGTEKRPNGASHEGTWELNTTVGPGVRRDPLGFELSGVWLRDSISHGLLRLPDGSEYAGPLYKQRNQEISEPLLTWQRRQAEDGNLFARYLMGLAYLDYRKPAVDQNQAARYLESSAKSGYPAAQFTLARLQMNDPDRLSRGLEWLLTASTAGYAEAQVLLGSLYQTGTHLPLNHRLAIANFDAALVSGNRAARNNLAWLLSTSPDDSLRDGERALSLIEPMALSFDDWGYLDTWAVALAEAGQFDAAIDKQKAAIEKYELQDGLGQAANQMRTQLLLFQSQMPYQEASSK